MSRRVRKRNDSGPSRVERGLTRRAAKESTTRVSFADGVARALDIGATFSTQPARMIRFARLSAKNNGALAVSSDSSDRKDAAAQVVERRGTDTKRSFVNRRRSVYIAIVNADVGRLHQDWRRVGESIKHVVRRQTSKVS